jgi:hypothetical protein
VPQGFLSHKPPRHFVVEQRLIGRHWGPWRASCGSWPPLYVPAAGRNSGKPGPCPTVHCQRTIIFLAGDWSARFSSAYVRLEIRRLAVNIRTYGGQKTRVDVAAKIAIFNWASNNCAALRSAGAPGHRQQLESVATGSPP